MNTFFFLGKGKVWTCIARTSYKSLPIKSLGFSSDTSLLGVGFGNTLCIYNSETLRLRCALSAPSGLDGSVSKMTITLPQSNDKSNLDRQREEFIEKRKKLLAAIHSVFENDDTNAIMRLSDAKNLKNLNTKSVDKSSAESADESMDESSNKSADESEKKLPQRLSDEQKKVIFNQVLASNGINLFQKIHIFDKFNLCGRAPTKTKQSYTEYCKEIDDQLENSNILNRILNLSTRHKFKFAYKYHQSNLQKQRTRNTLEALKRVVHFSKSTNRKSTSNGVSDDEILNQCSENLESETNVPPKPVVQITHVAFCTLEFAHLVIVCTEKRLLIWNLLTLRLQSAFKVEVEKLTIDPHTSLVAMVSKNHDLYVFSPNTPITLYQHKQLPKIDGLAWIPRKYPRSHSLTVDWQAHTELYFLSSDKQVLINA